MKYVLLVRVPLVVTVKSPLHPGKSSPDPVHVTSIVVASAVPVQVNTMPPGPVTLYSVPPHSVSEPTLVLWNVDGQVYTVSTVVQMPSHSVGTLAWARAIFTRFSIGWVGESAAAIPVASIMT